jgi:hypothetical protein
LVPIELPINESLLPSPGNPFPSREMNARNRITASSARSVPRRHRTTTTTTTTTMRAVSMLLLATTITSVDSFSPRCAFLNPGKQQTRAPSHLSLYAPPGSGYSRLEDEESALPDSYEPMMEYPGTMRPGRTPENMPFQDLPIGDDDPDPVPWPHFQQIEWHHQWEPPHEHPIPMEDFIEMSGRWATAEMEAAMRAGFRRDVRERREQAEAEKRDIIITDDDDDEEGEEPVALGDGIFGKLGSDADKALTAIATAPRPEGEATEEEEVDESQDDDGLDNFLLDLGLDDELDEEPVEETPAKAKAKKAPPAAAPKAAAPKKTSTISAVDDDEEAVVDVVAASPDLALGDDGDDDEEDEEESIKMTSNGGDITAAITVDDDNDLDLGLDDDDADFADDGDKPLEDFSDNDSLDTEDIFDTDGGFDFDDGDFDGGDDW